MWQLESDATKASSGSTLAGLENGTRTAAGEDDAATVIPPSNLHVCSREYVPFRHSDVADKHIGGLSGQYAKCFASGRGQKHSRPGLLETHGHHFARIEFVLDQHDF